jgi:hypothetical protein
VARDARSIEAEVAGIRIRVCGRDDLIRMKRAADRPKDRVDVIALTEPRTLDASHGVPLPPEPPGWGVEPQTGPNAEPASSLVDGSSLGLRPAGDLGASAEHGAGNDRRTGRELRPGPGPTLGM